MSSSSHRHACIARAVGFWMFLLAAASCGGTGSMEKSQGQKDREAMDACLLEQPCDTFIHDTAEGGEPYHSDNSEGFLPEETCIIEHLRDGKTGRYLYGTNDLFSNGRERVTAIIHVHASREVTFVRLTETVFEDGGGTPQRTFEVAQTCTLRPSTFFDDCLTNHNDSSHYEACMNAPWWDACEPQGPRCE